MGIWWRTRVNGTRWACRLWFPSRGMLAVAHVNNADRELGFVICVRNLCRIRGCLFANALTTPTRSCTRPMSEVGTDDIDPLGQLATSFAFRDRLSTVQPIRLQVSTERVSSDGSCWDAGECFLERLLRLPGLPSSRELKVGRESVSPEMNTINSYASEEATLRAEIMLRLSAAPPKTW